MCENRARAWASRVPAPVPLMPSALASARARPARARPAAHHTSARLAHLPPLWCPQSSRAGVAPVVSSGWNIDMKSMKTPKSAVWIVASGTLCL